MKPTLGPKTTIGPASLMSGVKREVSVVSLNSTSHKAAFSRNVLRAPASGAKIRYVGITNHVEMYHAANEADTWIFTVANASKGVDLNAQAASLSNQTLASTGFKSIPVNNGNSTLSAGDVLQIQLSVSGAPQSMSDAMCIVEWDPVSAS